MLRCITFILLTLSYFGEALIVPNELPSIVSLIISTIPQVKKGTDSRVGFGFRLGDHADFQVMLELGPQTNTRAIGTIASGDSDNTFKREVNPDSDGYNEASIENNGKKNSTYSDGSKWLKTWYKDNNKKIPHFLQSTSTDRPKEVSSMKTITMISQESLNQLQQLYKWAEKDVTTETSSETTTSTELPKISKASLLEIITPRSMNKDRITKELMDVDFD